MRFLSGSFLLALATGLAMMVGGETSAQRPNTPVPRQDTQPAPTEQQRCSPQNDPVNPSTPETRGQGAPGEQLAKSNGVICPPAGIDPEITTPPPGGGKTPIIPPPETRGVDPNLRPR